MTALSPTEILRGQFTEDRAKSWHKSLRVSQVVLIAIAVAAGLISALCRIETTGVGPLLTATSIITGLTFTMAMRFWERRIEINSAPQTPGYLSRKNLIETLGTHLIWTVLIGVFSTAVNAFAAVVSDGKVAIWLTAACVTFVSYQLLLVAESLYKLYNSSIELS